MRNKLKFILSPILGNDGMLSGKRILGTLLILMGMYLGWYGVVYRFEKLDPITMLIGVFFGAGLAFWGITSWTSIQAMKVNSDKPEEKTN